MKPPAADFSVFAPAIFTPGGCRPFLLLLAVAARLFATEAPVPRFVAPPVITRHQDGAVEWSAAVDCASSAALTGLIGARAVFALDRDLDGLAEAADSTGIAPADCEGGAVPLRRTFFPPHPAVLKAELRNAAGATGATHAVLTAGTGSLLAIARYCARPQDGEPEWIEIRNRTAFPVPLAAIRLEARALSGALNAGEAILSGSDTAELRLWQPGARFTALSSWPNLRNTGDTIRLSLAGSAGFSELVLDSLIHPATGSGGNGSGVEDCASLEGEGSGASASGYALELPAPRWRSRQGRFVCNIRAPAAGRYDLRAYDLDGAELCAIARNGTGPSSFSLPFPGCARLDGRAGTVILHLQPRGAPGARTVLRITE
jgi:hypothetical protein